MIIDYNNHHHSYDYDCNTILLIMLIMMYDVWRYMMMMDDVWWCMNLCMNIIYIYISSYVIHHTSYIRHHTSYIIHHTSYIIHHTSLSVSIIFFKQYNTKNIWSIFNFMFRLTLSIVILFPQIEIASDKNTYFCYKSLLCILVCIL